MADPRRVGPYRLARSLARGGMAEVWEAEGPSGPPVALKLLTVAGDADPAQTRKFLEEARIGSLLQHPNIVRLLDVGREGDHAYLVMELLEGRTLSGLADGTPLEAGGAVALALQALEGLAFAHEEAQVEGRALRVVHRDIKPSNLFLTRGGTLKIIDFGIALAGALDRTSTRTGQLRGSLPYCSPEQARNEPLDARTDLFSLCLVVHELLTGRRVFDQGSEAAILSAILWSPIPPVRARGADVPAALEEAIAWGLKADRAARPPSARALAEAFRQSLDPGELWTTDRLAGWLATRPVGPARISQGTSTLPPPSALQPPAPAPVAPAPTPSPARRWVPFAAGLFLIVGAAVWQLARPNAAPVPQEVSAPAQTPPPPVAAPAPAPQPPPAAAALPPPSPRPVRRRPAAPETQGFLTVDARPTWARIHLDGKDLGPTPIYRRPVPTGARRIDAVSPEGAKLRRLVKVQQDKETKVVLEFGR